MLSTEDVAARLGSTSGCDAEERCELSGGTRLRSFELGAGANRA